MLSFWLSPAGESVNQQGERGRLMRKDTLGSKRFWFLGFCMLCAAGVLFFLQNPGWAAGEKGKMKKEAQIKAFAVYQQKCLGCHDSVADPEKPGKTRDDWHLVVDVMHGYGMDLTADEKDQLIDWLYELRRGLEKEAG
jgi:hypothetical protein